MLNSYPPPLAKFRHWCMRNTCFQSIVRFFVAIKKYENGMECFSNVGIIPQCEFPSFIINIANTAQTIKIVVASNSGVILLQCQKQYDYSR